MSFEINQIPQALYYFVIKASINSETTNVQKVDFLPFIQVNTVAPACVVITGEQKATCEMNVGTSLDFCEDSTCQNYKATPFKQLVVNDYFFMLQKIVDTRF